jgi:acid stress-induced BolA-like protein IbaG/YrbA
MDLGKLESDIKDQLQADQVELSLEGNRLSVLVVAECFESLNRVKRQQRVYSFLIDYIANGSLHAVSIKAVAPAEIR